MVNVFFIDCKEDWYYVFHACVVKKDYLSEANISVF